MTFLLGFLCGYFLVPFAQAGIEKGYAREGIAKIYGKYYKLTPLRLNNGGEDKWEMKN